MVFPSQLAGRFEGSVLFGSVSSILTQPENSTSPQKSKNNKQRNMQASKLQQKALSQRINNAFISKN